MHSLQDEPGVALTTCARRSFTLLAVVLLACGAGSGARSRQNGARDENVDRDAIRSVFLSYARRVAAGDALGAVALLDDETMAFYDGVRRDALSLDAAALKARPLAAQVTIIRFRQGKSASELRDRPLAELVAAGIEPLVDPTRLRVDAIDVNGDGATVRVSIAGLEGGMSFDFRREGAEWRLSLVAAVQLAAEQLIDGDQAEEVLGFLARFYGVEVDALYALPL